MELSITDFVVFNEGNRMLGMASATLPDLNWITNTIAGAGIGGNIESPTIGHTEPMVLGLSFNQMTRDAMELTAPERHHIELRVATQVEDPVAGTLVVRADKHVMICIPKSLKSGSVAPATVASVSGEYAVHYWAAYHNNEKVLEIDPINNICIINGKDYLADVRKALGL